MPGPAEFISRVAGDLRDGKNVVFCLPRHFPRGFEIAIREETVDNDDWRWDSLECPDDGDVSPVDWLSSRFSPDPSGGTHRSISSLSLDSRFQGHVLWLRNITEHNWGQWVDFIEEYEIFCRSLDLLERTLFCIPLYGNLTFRTPKEDICLSVHSWRGVVDPIDISLFTSILLRNSRTSAVERNLVSSISSHLALWDPEAARAFTQIPLEQLLEPQQTLREIADWRGWNRIINDKNRSWAEGMSEEFEGRTRVHSALLNGNSKRKITRRIWSGQVAVLLPYIEQQRREVLETIGHKLRLPFTTRFGDTIHNLEDLEIGHIALQLPNLRGIAPRYARMIYRLRDIRNHLSHLDPVGVGTLAATLRQ